MAKTADKDRKARIEQMRKQQQASERRRTLLVVGAAVLAVLVLAAVVFKVVRDAQQERDVATLGVTSAAAACDPVVTDPVQGSGVHVGPQTDKPDVTKVDYKTVPPSSGEHYPTWEYPARAFYSVDDRPRMESLVHNLEHGYTIVWYTKATPQAQIDELKKISDNARQMKETGGKFIVSSWDEDYGTFPQGKTIGMSHWGAKNGYRQLCGAVSGEAIKAFVTAHPSSDAPEPNAQ